MRTYLGHFYSALVDSRADAALQHHLQHLGVGRLLLERDRQLLGLLLHVLDRHLDRRQHDLCVHACAQKQLIAFVVAYEINTKKSSS